MTVKTFTTPNKTSTTLTAVCNTCGKTLELKGAKVLKHDLYLRCRKAGWKWQSATIQLCPDHAKTDKAPKKAARSEKKAAKAGTKAPSSAALKAREYRARKKAEKDISLLITTVPASDQESGFSDPKIADEISPTGV